MASSVTLQDRILYVRAWGECTDEDVTLATGISDKLIDEHRLRKIRYLVDLSEVDKVRPSARQALQERLRNIGEKGDVRYAIVGLSGAFANLVKLFLKAVRATSEFRFFTDVLQADAWLRDE
ncbi:STAS/SEC14 domain-containing protein [candidate division WOR-3 bacterium]|nr:STAS/SEC14 domain-containing protein [candidate division WOR-3 bacterium]